MRRFRVLVCPWGRGLGHLSPAAALVRSLGSDAAVLLQPGEAVHPAFAVAQLETPALAHEGWNAFADARTFAELVSHDRLLLERAGAEHVLVDGRLSMVVAAEAQGVRCTSIVRESYAPGHVFDGEDDDFWSRMHAPAAAVMSSLGLEPLDSSDVRELFARHPALCPSYRWFEALDEEVFRDGVTFTGPLAYPGAGLEADVPEPSSTNLLVYGALRTGADVAALGAALRGTRTHAYIASAPAAVRKAADQAKDPALHVLGFIDLVAAIGRFDGVVVHGGHGACLAVADNEVRAVVVPPAHLIEQQSNAAKMERLGLARRHVSGDWSEALHTLASTRPRERGNRMNDSGAALRQRWNQNGDLAAAVVARTVAGPLGTADRETDRGPR